ncbi:MAG TPA: helix-turn-helix transcriptional regulator [Cyclobacteriaceae bacterium]
MKSFGETVRGLRTSKGFLLREVAAKLEIDPSLLSRVETGSKRPTRQPVVQLASVLQEDQDTLLIQYLSERVVYQLKDEEDLAIDAIIVAEKRIRYVTANNPNKKHQGGVETN